MMSFGDRVPAGGRVPGGTETRTPPVFRRVLVPVADASQVEHMVELAKRAGVSEARVLHLNLRENIGGRRFPLESDSSAAHVVEAAVFELSMAGIAASGQVRHALVDRAAEAIVAGAIEWGAELIVLGVPRRGEFAARLFGSVALRVLQHAPCPVLVASSADRERLHHAEDSVSPVAGMSPGANDDHAARDRIDDVTSTRTLVR
jgi:nucleotide-binding universal stress UspA family protein